MLRKLLFALALVLLTPLAANAAACTWSGGTGNWDNSNTASWSCGHVPTSADTVTFDGTSGGGTITVCGASSANCPNGAGVVTIAGFTMGAFTGTLDFATNNPNVTVSGNVSGTGTGTRTLNMGNGTWTMVGNGLQWNFITTTGLTLNRNSSSIVIQATGGGNPQFFGGGKTWGALTLDATANGAGYIGIEQGNSASNTFASCTFKAPSNILLRAGVTQTCTGGFTTVGSSASAPILIASDNGASSPATLAVGSASSCSYCGFRGITGATSAITATNSFDFGSNGGTLSISGPTGGGGAAYFIGGQ